MRMSCSRLLSKAQYTLTLQLYYGEDGRPLCTMNNVRGPITSTSEVYAQDRRKSQRLSQRDPN